MSEKSRIVAALGEQRLLLPALLNEALAANDRAKYRFTLLQSARDHAESPEAPFSDLRTERLDCGVTDVFCDEVVAGSVKTGPDTYIIPHANDLLSSLFDDLAKMLTPLGAAQKAEAIPFEERLEALSGRQWTGQDGSVTGAGIAGLVSGESERGDTAHLLVMEMHKSLNGLQAEIATENVDGALAYGLQGDDRSLIASFMKGVSRTNALKFDHPGLGTTATRIGGKLVIQNDIGTTDAHVLVLHVEGRAAVVTYTDNHLGRLLFFRGMLADRDIAWEEVHSRTDTAFAGGVYHLCVGTYAARSRADLKSYLAHLGSRLVFLIDWNRARKRLQLLVPKEDALALLAWGAANDFGHMAFMKAGGERMIFDALQFVAGGTLTYGVTLDELLGRDAAAAYLRFILKTCAQGLLKKRPLALIRDEARVELYNYYHEAQQDLLDIAGNHAALAIEIATGIRDGLLDLSRPDAAAIFGRIGQRAKEWERKADELVIRARELAKQSEHAAAIRQLLETADDITDELEEAAFHFTLLAPDGIGEEIRLPLADLARLLVEGTREYLKAIENARGIHRSGSPDDMHDFLKSIHRMVAIEEQSDAAERLVRKALVGTSGDYRQAFVIAECAKKLESAADSLMITGMTLRDQILGQIKER
ncbi:MAG TPA: hypothetical protein VMJ66_03990 [Geobacteraceae bacterium]|nr:hypothetical protein [Geobacteraceae bacterium]